MGAGRCTRWLLLVLVLIAPATARADGELTMRGVWYKEKATRVIQPMLDARFDVGDDAELDAHLLVDAITSASVAAGASGAAFSERRYELGAGYRQYLQSRLRLGATGRVSHEPDYDSLFGVLSGQLELFEKNLVIGLTIGGGRDAISNSGASGGLGGDPLSGVLTTVLGSLSVSQIVSRDVVVGLTYDLSVLRGFQENPYRTAITADGLVPERHPDRRIRHALAGSVRRYYDQTGTTVLLSHRVYRDDWDVTAHTPDLRLVQEAGDGVDFTVRYRFHWQSAADFFAPSYPSNDVDFVTDDIKLSDFTSHTIGVKLGIAGHVLGLDGRLEDARGELVLEYVDQNNRFGNAVIAHAALTLPFEY